jgi:putative hydrolase of the HAD superfamily
LIRAVLFDVGGPLDLETAFEAAIDADMRVGLALEGFEVDEAAWQAAHQHVIDAFAPNLYRALIWRLTGGDGATAERIYDWLEQRSHARDLFELRPGIEEVLEALKQRGLNLGLAANQPLAVLDRLKRHGIANYFEGQGISGVYGYRKPDVRLFLRICEDLAIAPHECIMVGDRIDNDVVPAKLLGMKTVLLHTGRHISQQPRSGDEVPDAEVYDAPRVLRAIELLLNPA